MRARLLGGPNAVQRVGLPSGGYAPGDVVFSQNSPGSQWLPADGRTISKASNPSLHPLLPLAQPSFTKLNIQNQSIQMRCVVYFKNTYILQGVTGVYSSADLLTFTNIGNPIGNTNKTVVGATGMMIFGSGNASYNTTLTNAWTNTQFDSNGYPAYCAAFGLGLFLCHNTSTGLKWMTEGGTSWTSCTFDDGTTGVGGFTVGALEYINGQFICQDSSGRIYRSTNGKSFTRIAGTNNAGFNRIFYINGFYYGHSNGSSLVQKSADLVNWTTIFTVAQPDNLAYTADASLGGVFLGVSIKSTTTPVYYISYNMTDFFTVPFFASGGATFVGTATSVANEKLFLIDNQSANIIYAGSLPSNDDDRVLPLIKMRTPAWIKAS